MVSDQRMVVSDQGTGDERLHSALQEEADPEEDLALDGGPLFDIPAPAPAPAPVVVPVAPPVVGDILLLAIGDGLFRPLVVTYATTLVLGPDGPDEEPTLSFRVSGVILCEPDDHTRPVFRGAGATARDPQRIWGRPDRFTPFGYGEYLLEGQAVGQWTRKAA